MRKKTKAWGESEKKKALNEEKQVEEAVARAAKAVKEWRESPTFDGLTHVKRGQFGRCIKNIERMRPEFDWGFIQEELAKKRAILTQMSAVAPFQTPPNVDHSPNAIIYNQGDLLHIRLYFCNLFHFTMV